jgi:hypothetical protein
MATYFSYRHRNIILCTGGNLIVRSRASMGHGVPTLYYILGEGDPGF